MNTELVVYAIQSLVKLGSASKLALEASARNQDILFPDFKPLEETNYSFVMSFFCRSTHRHLVASNTGPFGQYWIDDEQSFCPKQDSQSIDALLVAAAKIQAEQGISYTASEIVLSDFLVQAWVKDKQPLSPFARIALSAADIALDYVGNNVGVVGGGNGAKLLSSYAKALADVLPDDGNLSYQHQVYQSMAGMMLRAGFETIASHPDWLVSEEHLVALLETTITPLTEAFPLDSEQQIITFEQLKQALGGPATAALITTVATHQEAFLGANFNPQKAMGALTKSLFLNAAEIGLVEQFSREGLILSFKACLQVVASNPGLFIDSSDHEIDSISKQLLSNIATVLHQAPFPFDGQVSIAISEHALTAVSQHLGRFSDPNRPWHQVSIDVVQTIIQNISPHVGQSGALKTVFKRQDLIEMGRMIVQHIARSPAMLINSQNTAHSGLITAIANAMAADPKLLLSAEDWLQIVEVAASEATSDPMRLFNLDPAHPNNVLAGRLLTLLLESASMAATQHGATNVLFGHTLTEAMMVLLRAVSGNVQSVMDNISQFSQTLSQLNQLVAQHATLYGAKEWLYCYRILIQQIFSGVPVEPLTIQKLDQFLAGTDS